MTGDPRYRDLGRVIDTLAAARFDVDALDLADACWLAAALPAPPAPPWPPAPPPPDSPTTSAPPAAAAPPRPAAPPPRPPAAASPAAEHRLYAAAAAGPDGGRSLVALPDPPALPDKLALGRALRPLRRRVPGRGREVDLRATVARTAARRLAWAGAPLVPEFRRDRARWLDAIVLVDRSQTTAVWRRTVEEWVVVLQRLGAFRDLRVWHLTAGPAGPIVTSPGDDPRRPVARDVGELVDPSGRRLVMIASDCIDPRWSTPGFARWLARQAAAGPLAILQLLPPHLWHRTVLARLPAAVLTASAPGLPPHRLTAAAPDDEDPDLDDATAAAMRALPPAIPVVPLRPDALAAWAQLTCGAASGRATGVRFTVAASPSAASPSAASPTAAAAAASPTAAAASPTATAAAPTAAAASPTAAAASPTAAAASPSPITAPRPAASDPAALVRRFLAGSTGTARKLAAYLAAVPLTGPVLRLVRQELVPEAREEHLVEVLFSGLVVQRAPDLWTVAPGDELYDFRPGVREELLSGLGTMTIEGVARAIGGYLERTRGAEHNFFASVHGITDAAGTDATATTGDAPGARPFATVSAALLRVLQPHRAGAAPSAAAARGGAAADLRVPADSEARNEIGDEVRSEIDNDNEDEDFGDDEVDEVDDADEEIGNQVNREIDNEIGNKVSSELGNEASGELGDQVSSESGDPVSNELDAEAGDELGSDASDELAGQADDETAATHRLEDRSRVRAADASADDETAATHRVADRSRVRAADASADPASSSIPAPRENGMWILLEGDAPAPHPAFARELGTQLVAHGFSIVLPSAKGLALDVARAFANTLLAQGYSCGFYRTRQLSDEEYAELSAASGSDAVMQAVDGVLILGASGPLSGIVRRARGLGLPIARAVDVEPAGRATAPRFAERRAGLEAPPARTRGEDEAGNEARNEARDEVAPPATWTDDSAAAYARELAAWLVRRLAPAESRPAVAALVHQAAIALDEPELADYRRRVAELRSLRTVVPRSGLARQLAADERRPSHRLVGYHGVAELPPDRMLLALAVERRALERSTTGRGSETVARTLHRLLEVQRTAFNNIEFDAGFLRAAAVDGARITRLLAARPDLERSDECRAMLESMFPGGELRIARDRLEAAIAYRALRRDLPSGPTRTRRMTHIVEAIQETAIAPTRPEAERWFEDGDDGERIVALALVLGAPDPAAFPLVLQAIRASRSAFEQFTAMCAVGPMLPDLSPAQRDELRDELVAQRSGPPGTITAADPDRWHLSGQLLTDLAKTSRRREPAKRARHTILIVAANPVTTGWLELDEDRGAMARALRVALYRDDFEVAAVWAASASELLDHIAAIRPSVIHFASHDPSSPALAIPDDGGQPLSPAALAALAARMPGVQVIVLRGCYDDAQAKALSAGVDCVVGTDATLGFDVTRAFILRFYSALATRRSAADAFGQGLEAIAGTPLSPAAMPQLVIRDGVDPAKVILEPPSRRDVSEDLEEPEAPGSELPMRGSFRDARAARRPADERAARDTADDEPTSPGLQPASGKRVVLFLPGDSARAAQEQDQIAAEYLVIGTAIRREGLSGFDAGVCWPLYLEDLLREIAAHQPVAIHVSGHGDDGVRFLTASGMQPLAPSALGRILDLASPNLRLVVWHGGSNAEQLEALRSRIDCVVALDARLGREASRTFLDQLYHALGAQRSVGDAFDRAMAALSLDDAGSSHPRCLVRDGVDAHRVFLRSPFGSAPATAPPSTGQGASAGPPSTAASPPDGSRTRSEDPRTAGDAGDREPPSPSQRADASAAAGFLGLRSGTNRTYVTVAGGSSTRAARTYREVVHDHLGYLAVWPPGPRLEVGDVGTIIDGRFEQRTTLHHTLGVPFQTSVTAAVPIQLSWHARMIGDDTAPERAIELDRGGAFWLTTAAGRHYKLERHLVPWNPEHSDLQAGLEKLVAAKQWDLRWIVISEVIDVDAAIIALSHAARSRIEIRRDASGQDVYRVSPDDARTGTSSGVSLWRGSEVVVLYSALRLRRSRLPFSTAYTLDKVKP